MTIDSTNPFDGTVIHSYQTHTDDEVNEIIRLSHDAWEIWRSVSFSKRAQCFKNAVYILRERKVELATLMALEMGKPLKGGIAEIEKCADCCDFTRIRLQNFSGIIMRFTLLPF